MASKNKTQASPMPFEKLSISVSSDLAHSLRVAAVVVHRVSESSLVETAIRRFLSLPESVQATALDGLGRRRTGVPYIGTSER